MSGENYPEKVSVNINTSTLAQIDLLVDNGYYSNRSDFINQAVREGLHKHQNTLDRIIDSKLEKGSPDQRRKNPNRWFVGVYGFDKRALAEMKDTGEQGAITGYGVLSLDEELDDEELFAAVKSIRVKGKVIAKPTVKAYYGLK